MDIDEKRISVFAYHIWESEGRPEGEAARHWEMARKLAEAEDTSPPVHVEETFPDAAPDNSHASTGDNPEASDDEGTSDLKGQLPRS